MDEFAALMQAVVDDPDDDVRRLVAADWLEENGRGREAEFVRAQVQIARCILAGPDPFRSPAGLWDRQLAPDLRDLLLRPFLPLLRNRSGEEEAQLGRLQGRYAFGFHRGFLDALVIYGGAATRFSRHAEDLFAQVPLVHLCAGPTPDRPPFDYPSFGYSGDELTEEGLRSLLGLPLLGRLRTLDLRGHHLGDTCARLVLDCPHLAPTVRLLLDDNFITETAVRRLRQRFGDNVVVTPYDPDMDIPF